MSLAIGLIFSCVQFGSSPLLYTSQTCRIFGLTRNRIVFLAARNKWALMFNNDPEVRGRVAQVMPILALFQVRLISKFYCSNGKYVNDVNTG